MLRHSDVQNRRQPSPYEEQLWEKAIGAEKSISGGYNARKMITTNTAAANAKNSKALLRLMIGLALPTPPVPFARRGSERTGIFGGALVTLVMLISSEGEGLIVFMDVR